MGPDLGHSVNPSCLHWVECYLKGPTGHRHGVSLHSVTPRVFFLMHLCGCAASSDAPRATATICQDRVDLPGPAMCVPQSLVGTE